MKKYLLIVLACLLSTALLCTACEENEGREDRREQYDPFAEAMEKAKAERLEKEADAEAREKADAEAQKVQEQRDAAAARDGEKVKQVIEHLFEISQNEDCSLAAQFILYQGADKKRFAKESYGFEVQEDMLEVLAICSEIGYMLLDLDRYEYVDFIQQQESQGEWNVWEMKMYKKDGRSQVVRMPFLRVGRRFLLSEVDRDSYL